jgi:hypothetical protein
MIPSESNLSYESLVIDQRTPDDVFFEGIVLCSVLLMIGANHSPMMSFHIRLGFQWSFGLVETHGWFHC